MNMHEYMKLFDELEGMDFDLIVPGHHGSTATHADLLVARNYVKEVLETITRVLTEDHQGLRTQAIEKYGRENAWAVASVQIQDEVDSCAKEIKSRWIKKLEGVDIWAARHCRTALI